MIKYIKDDLYQIGEHVQTEHGFEAILTYILLNEGRPILIDCGSQIHRDSVMNQLNELVGNARPDIYFSPTQSSPMLATLRPWLRSGQR